MPKPSYAQVTEFEKWVATAPPGRAAFNVSALGNNPEMPEWIVSQLGDPNAILALDQVPAQWIEALSNAKCRFTFLSEVPYPSINDRRIAGIRADHLRLGTGSITIEHCYIGRLGGVGVETSVSLVSTFVSDLHLHELNAKRFEWNGGYLGRIKFGSPIGDFLLRNVRLPTRAQGRGIQWLRDARADLTEVNNFIAAGLFHASELALSVPDELSWVSRWASRVYRWGSNYGNSLALPLYWFGAALAAIFVLALLVGTEANTELAIGWHHSLTGNAASAKLLRASIYAVQSIFNPLNLIVPRPLVSVSHWAAALGSFVLGLGGRGGVRIVSVEPSAPLQTGIDRIGDGLLDAPKY